MESFQLSWQNNKLHYAKKERITVYEHTSHPSKIESLNPCRFVADSSQMTPSALIWHDSYLWKDIIIFKWKQYLHIGVNLANSMQTKGPFTHNPKAVTMRLRQPKKKCWKAIPRHLQNHVVRSRTLKRSVKSYVTGPSIKCHFNRFLFMRVLKHDKIE